MNCADALMLVVTLVGVVIAGLALREARGAKEHAGTANIKAEDSNKIAKDGLAKAEEANGLASEANAISAQAAQDSRDVPKAVAWNDYVVALAAIQTFDPTSEPLGDRLVALRTRSMLLIDLLDWDGFDKWLAAEQQAIVYLMHEADVVGQSKRQRLGRDLTTEEVVEIVKEMHTRVAALTTNVRRLRKVGTGELPYDEFAESAWDSARATCKRNGWPVPTGKIEGIEPYEPGS